MISSGSSAVSNRPLKKSSARMRRLLVTMVAPSPRTRRRIVGVRIVVGDRAADGAAMAHRRIADQARELGERRDVLLDDRRGRDVDVAGEGADDQRAALHLDAGQPLDLGQVDDVLRPREAKLHGRDQRVSAGEELGLLLTGQKACRLPYRGRAMEFEFVHGVPSLIPNFSRSAYAFSLCALVTRSWPWPWRRPRSLSRCCGSRCSGRCCLRARDGWSSRRARCPCAARCRPPT